LKQNKQKIVPVNQCSIVFKIRGN